MDDERLKKRIGYAREEARKILKQYYGSTKKSFCPPIPVFDIAKSFGFEVDYLERIDESRSAIMIPEHKLIGLNKSHHIHRQRFSVGHELGHYFLNHSPEEELEKEGIDLCDKESDEFSAELLIPLELLKKQMKFEQDIEALSKTFNVSITALVIKITSQNLLKYL